jgi:phosphoglycolate phosphatase-like HAD superfamily hydrolase
LFNTVLFDIDGVMLSEERYFDASALTIYELLGSPRFLGADVGQPGISMTPDDEQIQAVRSAVFQRDQVLERLKNVGVNANWDMVYLGFVAEFAALLGQLPRTESVAKAVEAALRDGWTADALCQLGALIRENIGSTRVAWQAYDDVFGRATSRDELFAIARALLREVAPEADEQSLWALGRDTFQEWYLGDEYSGQSIGKQGFLASEQPLVAPESLALLFEQLKGRGIHLGIGTGRPRIETEVPLTHFGWWSFFSVQYVTTASDVLQAETAVPTARPLSKPHPFSYLRSLTGEHEPQTLLAKSLPLDCRNEVLIVGDSIADALAAKSLGASFAAVLTGLEGELARPKFEELKADFILNDVLALNDILLNQSSVTQ